MYEVVVRKSGNYYIEERENITDPRTGRRIAKTLNTRPVFGSIGLRTTGHPIGAATAETILRILIDDGNGDRLQSAIMSIIRQDGVRIPLNDITVAGIARDIRTGALLPLFSFR